jgi:hypothetical protein
MSEITLSDIANRIEAIRKATPLERKLAKELLVRREAWDIIEMLDLGKCA